MALLTARCPALIPVVGAIWVAGGGTCGAIALTREAKGTKRRNRGKQRNIKKNENEVYEVRKKRTGKNKKTEEKGQRYMRQGKIKQRKTGNAKEKMRTRHMR